VIVSLPTVKTRGHEASTTIGAGTGGMVSSAVGAETIPKALGFGTQAPMAQKTASERTRFVV
jgi:hypothetical protein